jgi:tetratricopeptide (TPR) repeat protein
MSIISKIKQRLFTNHKQETGWDTAIRWLLLAVVFLMPIFFLPHTTYAVEFNKVLLFNVLILITAVVYLLKMLVRREATFVVSYFDWVVLAFVVFNLVSFIFSSQHYFSAVGVSGYYHDSIISVICFALFFYLLRQTIRGRRDVLLFLTVLLASAFLTILYNFFQLFGLHIFPWALTHDINFNAVSPSAEGFAVYLGLGLIISFGLCLLAPRRWLRVLLGIVTVACLALLFLLDQTVIFYVLAVSFFIILLFITWRSKYFSNIWVVLPTVILTILVLFAFVNSSMLTKLDIKTSATLDQSTSASIAWQSLRHSPLWGSGQQTYTLNFEKYRTVHFNDSPIWNLRFIKGSNQWLTLLATLGLAGAGLLLVTGVWFLIIMWRQLTGSKKPDQSWALAMLLFVMMATLFITSFIMPSNFLLTFLWWFLLALGLTLRPGFLKTKKTTFGHSPARSVSSGITFVAVTVGIVLIIFVYGRLWLADYYFIRAQEGVSQKIDITQVIQYLTKASDLNPRESVYLLNMAQGYATQAQLEALQASPDMIKMQQYTQQAITTLKRAKESDPDNPFVYEQEAAIYDSLRSIVSNADDLSVAAYAAAVRLEPSSPLAYLNLGRAQLLSARTKLAGLTPEADKTSVYLQIDQAIGNLQQVSQLKSDLPIAEYTMAVALDLRGQTDEAIARVEALTRRYPQDADIWSGLGSLYAEKQQYDQAVTAYQKALQISPDDSNLHWQLALVYEKQGKNDQASSELDIVQKANPDNETVKEKIESLKSKSGAEQ